jgi:hypothetical protein
MRPELPGYDAWKTSGPGEPDLYEGPINVTLEFGEDPDDAEYQLDNYVRVMAGCGFDLVSSDDEKATFTLTAEHDVRAVADSVEAYLMDNYFTDEFKALNIDADIETPGWPDYDLGL